MNTIKKHTAFTLAEVLITLGIIGVVAAMTVPTLMNKTSDAELKSGFKKLYSTISQSILNITNEDGSLENQFSDDNSFKNIFASSFKATKSCDSGDSSCWTCNGQRKDDYFYSRQSVSGTQGWWYVNRPTIALSDGALMNFSFLSGPCTGDDYGLMPPYNSTICGAIFIDVNGCKAPNTWGRDIFNIEVQKNKIFPLGESNDTNTVRACDKTSSYAGMQCAENVLMNKTY